MSIPQLQLLELFKNSCRDVKFWQTESKLHPENGNAKEKYNHFSGLSLGYYNAYETIFGQAPIIK